jgi:hypothetical protein
MYIEFVGLLIVWMTLVTYGVYDAFIVVIISVTATSITNFYRGRAQVPQPRCLLVFPIITAAFLLVMTNSIYVSILGSCLAYIIGIVSDCEIDA